jgi:hypothetical protein
MDSEWKQTRRELKRLENGSYVPERITEERVERKILSENKKEAFDIVVKTIGVLSIFIPLFLLYFSYNQEIQTKKNENLAQLYTDISFDLENLLNADAGSGKFHESGENLLFKYQARLSLFKNDALNESYSYIKTLCMAYRYLKETMYCADSVITGYNEIYSHYRASFDPDGFTVEDTYKIVFRDSMPMKLKQIENARRQLVKFRSVLFKNENSLEFFDSLSLRNELLHSNSTLKKTKLYKDSAAMYSADIAEELKDLANFLAVRDTAWFENYFGTLRGDKSIEIFTRVMRSYSISLTVVESELAQTRRIFEMFLLKHIN